MSLFQVKSTLTGAIITEPLSAIECERILSKLNSDGYDYEIIPAVNDQQQLESNFTNQLDLFQ